MRQREIILSKNKNGEIPHLTEFLEDKMIPTNTILCKKLTGLGATYSEIKASRHSIIIEPNRPVIIGKCKDAEHKNDNLFGVYHGIYTDDIIDYIEESKGKYLKILTTPESFHKVEEALKATDIEIRFHCFLLFDECHKIIKDSDYRDTISLPMDLFFECEHKALVSATPLDFTDPRFKDFEIMQIVPDFDFSKELFLCITNNVLQTVKETLESQDGNIFIFCNSTDMIYNLIKQLDLFDDSAVFCSTNSVKKLRNDKDIKLKQAYEDWDIKHIRRCNWLTSRFYNAVDIKLDEQPNVIMLSNCYFSENTIIDPYTDAIQAIGRFRNGTASITHIVNINPNLRVQSKEEVRGYIRGLEYVHSLLTRYRDTAPNAEKRIVWQEFLENSPFNKFLVNGQKSYYKIDCHVDDEVVKGYYSNKELLYSTYTINDAFNVYMVEKFYKFGDYERLQRDNPKLTKKESRIQIIEQLEMLGNCATQMEFEYRQELVESDPFIVQAYEIVGREVIERLNYREKLIREAIILKHYHEKSTGNEAIMLIKNTFKENTWYSDNFIKKELKRIFKILNIKYPKTITSHTIGDFFEYTDKPTKKSRGKLLHRGLF